MPWAETSAVQERLRPTTVEPQRASAGWYVIPVPIYHEVWVSALLPPMPPLVASVEVASGLGLAAALFYTMPASAQESYCNGSCPRAQGRVRGGERPKRLTNGRGELCQATRPLRPPWAQSWVGRAYCSSTAVSTRRDDEAGRCNLTREYRQKIIGANYVRARTQGLERGNAARRALSKTALPGGLDAQDPDAIPDLLPFVKQFIHNHISGAALAGALGQRLL